MYARVYDSGQIVIRTHDQRTTGTQDTRGTRPPEKGGTQAKQNLLLLGDLHDNNEKKVKKNLEI